jgi:hypothetical protein
MIRRLIVAPLKISAARLRERHVRHFMQLLRPPRGEIASL